MAQSLLRFACLIGPSIGAFRLGPHLMDELLDDMQAQVQREKMKLKKTIQRYNKTNHLTPGLRILVCILVLLEIPWEIIQAIAVCKLRMQTNSRYATPLTITSLEEIAKGGLLLNPGLVHGPLNDDDTQVFIARKWVMECKLAVWVAQQNLKGVAVPKNFVISEYTSYWGMGPHKANLVSHLSSLGKKNQQMKWLRMLKKKWDLTVSTMPHRPLKSPEELHDKVIDVITF